MSIIFLYIVHQIVLCLGLASSLTIDIFIIIVEKTKQIRGIEKKIMNRIMSYSFLFSVFVFITQLIYLSIVYLNQNEFNLKTYVFSVTTFFISAILLFCTATQKYYQFKILERYQEQHSHLSDSFIKHHKELKYTSIITLILWLVLYISYLLI